MCINRLGSQWISVVLVAEDIALLSFLASMNSVDELVETILSRNNIADTNKLVEAVESWRGASCGAPLLDDLSCRKAWDLPIVERNWENMLRMADQVSRARLLATAQRESVAWLNALPVSLLGTLLDSESFRVAIALTVCAEVCIPHSCRCGGWMDSRVLHGLSCKYSAGHFPRLSPMNDVIKRALQKAGLPLVLEPPGLDRGDRSRPDGITVFPFSCGRSLVGIARVLILLLGYTWIGQQWKLAQLQTAPRSASAVNTLLLQRHISLNQLQLKQWEYMVSPLE